MDVHKHCVSYEEILALLVSSKNEARYWTVDLVAIVNDGELGGMARGGVDILGIVKLIAFY